MITTSIARYVFGKLEMKYLPIFKIIGYNLLAGYVGEGRYVAYFVNWQELISNRLKKISLYELPEKFLNTRELYLIGGFIDGRIPPNTVIVNLLSGCINGFADFKFSGIFGKILKNYDVKSIKEEIQRIYDTVYRDYYSKTPYFMMPSMREKENNEKGLYQTMYIGINNNLRGERG